MRSAPPAHVGLTLLNMASPPHVLAILARILVTLIHALQARGRKRGLATLCIGGGEATALALELL